MSDAQVFEIALDSPLEPNTEHSIVPVTQPTFSYNPQSPVSGLLMNAIKYEGDGVFCGKYRYDYDVKYTYKIVGTGGLEVGDKPAIDPEDVARNFYWYEEYLRYAFDVSYPWTNQLKNTSFVVGFLKKNILAGMIGQQLLVDRTNSEGFNEAGLKPLLYDLVNGGSLPIPDGADQYVIEGKTHRNRYDFRLLADVYNRILHEYVHTNTGKLDDVRSFIPVGYEANLIFGMDKITTQIVHETRDQDNIAFVMSQVIENGTASDLDISEVNKTNNISYTQLFFDDAKTKYIKIDDLDEQKNELSPAMQLSFAKTVNPLTLIEEKKVKRYNPGLVTEYDELKVINVAPIYPDPRKPTLKNTEDLTIICDEAIIAVAEGSGFVQVIPAEKATSYKIRNTTISMYQGGVTRELNEIVIKDVIDVKPVISAAAVNGTFGRPRGTAPSYWTGRIDDIFCELRLNVYMPNIFIGDSPVKSISRSRDTFWSTDIPAAWMKAEQDARNWLKNNVPNAKIISITRKHDNPKPWDDYTCTVTIKYTIPNTPQLGALRLYSYQFRVVCNDIESGDWSVLPGTLVDENGTPLVPGTSTFPDNFPFKILDSCVMNEDLCSGTIKVDLFNSKQQSRNEDLGIVFSFEPVKVKYIKDVKFTRSNRDVISLQQGDQMITAKVSFSEWDFTETLVARDGIQKPTSILDEEALPTPPTPSLEDILQRLGLTEAPLPEIPAEELEKPMPPTFVPPIPIEEDFPDVSELYPTLQEWIDITEGQELVLPNWEEELTEEEQGWLDLFRQQWLDDWILNDWPLIAWIKELSNEYIIKWQKEWLQGHVDDWQKEWLRNWIEEVSGAGSTHRQNIWVTFIGQFPEEIVKHRYVLNLPFNQPGTVVANSTEYWSPITLSTWVEEYRLSSFKMEGTFRELISDNVVARKIPLEGPWRVDPVELSLDKDRLQSRMEQVGLQMPFSFSEETNPINATEKRIIAYGWLPAGKKTTYMLGEHVILEPQVGKPGKYRFTELSDKTERTIKVRRAFILSSNGDVAGAYIKLMKGPLHDLRVDIGTIKYNILSLVYNYGLWNFDPIRSVPEVELSYENAYERQIQWSDGTWVEANEFLDPTVEQKIMDQIDLQSAPEIIEALTQVLQFVFEGATIERINRFVLNSVLDGWGTLSTILASYNGNNALLNRAPTGEVYRLVFRDSDKALFDFLPKGMYIRGNERIQYLSYSVKEENNEFVSANVKFKYDNRAGDTKTATVEVFGEGKAYINCDAHDPVTGVRETLTLANPDLDYAIIPQQFDTDLATENMYYIDQEHILKVTSKEFQLLTLKDNSWDIEETILKEKLLGEGQEALRYGVTCAEERYPVFYIITSQVSGIGITLMALDRFKDIFDYMLLTARTIDVLFSDVLISGFASSRMGFLRTPPPSVHFVNSIKITSTRVKDQVLIGIVYDRGIHQWTIVLNAIAGKSKFIFNGYGCVGIDGTVTGSAVPMYAMNQRSGISVIIRDKPDPKAAFKATRMAYVSGQGLTFIDSTFNRGICVSAKISGNQFRLKSLPLRFSRYQIKSGAASSSFDRTVKGQWIAPPNFGFVHYVTSWAWARAVAAASLNSWVTSAVNQEEDEFLSIKVEKKEEIDHPRDFWIALGFAALSDAVTSASNKANEKLETLTVKLEDKIRDRFLYTDDERHEAMQERIQGEILQIYSDRLKAQYEENTEGEQSKGAKALGAFKRALQKVSFVSLDAIKATIMSLMAGNPTNTAIAVAEAALGSSNLYSVNSSQNVWAGPGFVQVHFAQGSRISGSYSWGHTALGKGTIFVPSLPMIPIPFAGAIDINNRGATGIHPLQDFAPSPDCNLEYQPNFNIGPKHIVYSYPTLDVQDHVIKQTQLAPATTSKKTTLYESEYKKREYNRQILAFDQWDEEEIVVDNCSMVQGVDSYKMSEEELKVPVMIDAGAPLFTSPGTFDYCVYPSAELYYSATAGEVTGVSIRDTLVLDGEPSNVIILKNLPLIASAYTCLEITRTLTKDTIRPQVYSGDTLVFPMTGRNTIKGLQVLHGCDAYTNRVAKLVGDTGVDAATIHSIFSHVQQGSVKTGSLFPPIQYLGKFSMVPVLDNYIHPLSIFAKYLNNIGQSSENLLGYRFSIPVIHKSLGMLPAAIQTLAPYKAHVINGVTSLTTDLRTTTSRNKSPAYQDFTIYGHAFRAGSEYVAKLNAATGTVELQDVVATLGLKYLGSTPQMAWFYAPAINCFYTFTMTNPVVGATAMKLAANAFRFRDVESGVWEFVAQEVVFKSLLERDIDLRRHYYKDIVRVQDRFLGMIYPPNQNIVDQDGEFDITSTANGIALQGRRRGQVNRFVMHDYMFRESIQDPQDPYYGIPGYSRYEGANDGLQLNHGNWVKVRGATVEDFYSEREYDFEKVENKIYGYYLEPFKLATSFLGLGEDKDCLFEWEINFALTPMMQRILKDKYIVVYLAAETIVPGGSAISGVTRLYLKEDMFGRQRVEGALGTSKYNVGYYTFRFTSRNGAGNSEKLYIWSDGCVALRGLKLMVQTTTDRRTMPLITQPDIAVTREL